MTMTTASLLSRNTPRTASLLTKQKNPDVEGEGGGTVSAAVFRTNSRTSWMTQLLICQDGMRVSSRVTIAL
jgi:hypothetical protein